MNIKLTPRTAAAFAQRADLVGITPLRRQGLILRGHAICTNALSMRL
jgi:hypothetical protein